MASLYHEITELKINPEYQSLIPALSAEERAGLERQLIEYGGCRDAICTWNGTIVDGHNRYEICTRLGLNWYSVPLQFADDLAAKEWIYRNQFERRNLNDAVRIKLALELESVIKERAKKNQQMSQGQGVKGLPNLANLNPTNTREEVAKLAGVSHGTLSYAKKVFKDGSEELKQEMLSGKKSIYKAFQEVAPEPRTCRTCGKTLPITEFYAQKTDCKSCDNNRRNGHKNNPDNDSLLLTPPPRVTTTAINNPLEDEAVEFIKLANDFYIESGEYAHMPKAFVGLDASSDAYQICESIIKRMNAIKSFFSGGKN